MCGRGDPDKDGQGWKVSAVHTDSPAQTKLKNVAWQPEASPLNMSVNTSASFATFTAQLPGAKRLLFCFCCAVHTRRSARPYLRW